jgi:hypothetical protein
LEKAGLVLEYAGGLAGDCGYSRSAVTNGIAGMPSSGDALEDEKLRVYMIKKAREETLNRIRRMKRLRKLARMDFKMIGGVAPIGFYGGSGGGSGMGRPTSMGNRT